MTTKRDTYLALARRCEQEEPSRHVDFLIRYHALGVPMTDTEPCPLFTSSLDAAVTLVPEGWEWSYSNTRPHGHRIELWRDDNFSSVPSAYSDKSKTFAQGVAAAGLRALAALEPT
jgi:hypothetical protein